MINQHWAGCFIDWISRRYDLDKCEYGATLGGPQKWVKHSLNTGLVKVKNFF